MSITVQQWHDRDSWNDFVASTPHAHFQQSWEWGELAPDLGGQAIRLAAVDRGAIVGAFQLFINPIAHLHASYLYVPRGPAVCQPAVETLGPLLDRAAALGRQRNAVGIRLEPNAAAHSSIWTDNLAALGLRPTFPPSQPRSSWLLDITPDEDALLAAMKQKTRYNIRLAARKGVRIEASGLPGLDDFYPLYQDTAERDDFFIQPQSFYARMFSLFEQAGSFCLLFARYHEEIIAAVTLLRFGSTCWYVHGASANHHRNLMAPYLLQWEAIRRARSWGCTLYDFRAIPDILREDQDMWGVYRFKEGFGGYPFTTLHTWSAPYRPTLFALWQLFFRARFDLTALRRRRQGLPARQFA
jgi:peptidoglycan pentaglycine glycine transferase (the first glycine)